MGLLSQKLRCGVLELATETGPIYASLTLVERAYLLWTFRNFPRLSRVVLNERQREMIDKLCRTPNLRHRLPDDVPIIGVVENVAVAVQRKSVASAPAVVAINSAEAHVVQAVGGGLTNATARVHSREPRLQVRTGDATQRVTSLPRAKSNPRWDKPHTLGDRRKWFAPALVISVVALVTGLIYVGHNRAASQKIRLQLDQSYAPVSAAPEVTPAAERTPERNAAEIVPKPSAARTGGRQSTPAVPLRAAPAPISSKVSSSTVTPAALPLPTTFRVERTKQPPAAGSASAIAESPTVSSPVFVERETSATPPAVARMVISAAPVSFGYPVAPRATLLGKVHLRIVIAADGSVKDVSALSGNPALADAALKAVRRWKYRAPLMNGQAVEAETNVTINFAGDDAVTIAYR